MLNVDATSFPSFSSTAICLAIRSMSAISVICLWNPVPPAVTRFQSSIIIAAIVLSH